jgi:hypothetical protein
LGPNPSVRDFAKGAWVGGKVPITDLSSLLLVLITAAVAWVHAVHTGPNPISC